MTNHPIYRGTKDELEASQDVAREWMINQCVAAISDVEAPIRDEVKAMLDVAKERNTMGFRQSFGSTVSYCYTFSSSVQRSDCFYVWHIGSSVQHRWGDQKFLLRKNGTIHADNLRLALVKWARDRLGERRRRSVIETNRKMYADIGKLYSAMSTIDVRLSETEVGRCQVRYHSAYVKLGPCKCEISDVVDAVSKMSAICSSYEEAMSRYNQQ